MKYLIILFLSIVFFHGSFAQQTNYVDTTYFQDRSQLFRCAGLYDIHLGEVAADRNGNIQITSNVGILMPHRQKLVTDHQYRFMADLEIISIKQYQDQFIYLTDKQVFSNAWAGKISFAHSLSDASAFAGGASFDFLVGGNSGLAYYQDGFLKWKKSFHENHTLNSIAYDKTENIFFIVTNRGLHTFRPDQQYFNFELAGTDFTCVQVHMSNWLVGTSRGLLHYNVETKKHELDSLLPWTEITCLAVHNEKIWVGTTRGAFTTDPVNDFNYYASRRWLVDDHVLDIEVGVTNQMLILTNSGLSQISFSATTLYEKALHFERQVRSRHIRHGFNSAQFVMKRPGDLSSGSVVDSDNDGLWTSMYLASQLFRYKVTGSMEAYQNAMEAFDAMERLNTINPIDGFLSRSFERRSYAKHDLDAWRRASDPEWDWKGTTSSDESIGHYFAFSLIAEIVPDTFIRNRAIKLILDMTDHILENDLYLVDIDGKPTRWGRWNPEYVNGFPKGVGDRKLNSSNITAFLQTAFHFSGDEKYKKAAIDLFEEHGYLENLMMPMEEIGTRNADDLSSMLSSSWNHSDDEMYFLSYWYLYHYAFSPTLKDQYKSTIKNHWDIERPEKDALWNFCYAMTGAQEFDLEESIWYLKEFPMDLVDYTISNSHRRDIKLLPANFRNQTTETVLPPDEKPIFKHNTNTFTIDRSGGARSEASGDIYLLPYWMGRYLGIISAPKNN